jgi:hypothetical protein
LGRTRQKQGSQSSGIADVETGELRFPRSAWTFSLIVIALLLVVGGALLRLPTIHAAYYLRFAASHLAYSDIVALYDARHLDRHFVPYIQQRVEYPVLIGLLMWLSSYAPGIEGYFLVNAVVLLGCVLGCVVLLASLRPPAKVAWFALAPTLTTCAVLNWDALALVAFVGGVALLIMQKPSWAGVCIGLGAAAKVFPIFALPVMLAECVRLDWAGQRQHALLAPAFARTWQLLAGFGIVTVVLNLPFAMANFAGWIMPYTYQATRTPNIDSFWAGLPQLPNVVPSLAFAGTVVIGSVLVAVFAYGNGHWQEGISLVLLLFLLTTKVYSPQYDLWLLPLMALILCPLWVWLVFVAADAIYYTSVFAYYAAYAGAQLPFSLTSEHAGLLLRASVWGRELMLVILFAWVLRRFIREPLRIAINEGKTTSQPASDTSRFN